MNEIIKKRMGNIISESLTCTVPKFNSCTKYVGSPGIIHNCTCNCYSISWAWMTSELNLSYICKLYGSLMCFFDKLAMSMCLYNQALADVPVDWCRNYMSVL